MRDRRQEEDKGTRGQGDKGTRGNRIDTVPHSPPHQVSLSSSPTPVWLIGGTQESAQLAKAIALANLPCIISVTTRSARALYPDAACLQVLVGRFTLLEIEAFVQQQQVIGVLDASHPYAVEISQAAIAVCQKLGIPYLRYERPVLAQGGNR